MMLYNIGVAEFGIWNFINVFMNNILNGEQAVWYLVVGFSESYYKIAPYELIHVEDQIEKLSVDNIRKIGINDEIYDIIIFNGLTILPVVINKNIAFYLCIESKIQKFNSNMLKYTLESLLKAESTDLFAYPSFLPYLLSNNEPEIENINIKLRQKKSFFFLNGLDGTGKHTFIKNHLMYCYGINPFSIKKAKQSEMGKVQILHFDAIEILIIDELAYCTEIDQRIIQKTITDLKQETILFVCSLYDPLVLASRGVIGEELANLCIKERIIFHSLQKRSSSLIGIASKYLFFKGINLPKFFSEKWLNRQVFNNGFNDIISFLQDYSMKILSVGFELEKGNSIRGIVKGIEVLSIEYAIKIVGKSQNKIAKYLGISRGSLQHKLKKYEYSDKEWEE